MADPSAYAALVQVWDYLIKLAEMRRAKRLSRFDRVFKPMHDQLRDAHRDYMRMFDACAALLPRQLPDGLWIIPGARKAVRTDSPEVRAALKHACDLFASHRESFAGERVAVRSSARRFLTLCSTIEEQRYVMAVIHYFLDPSGANPNNRLMDRQIERIIKDGPSAVLNSPSFFIEWYLKNIADLDPADPQLQTRAAPYRMADAISSVKASLNGGFAKASTRFDELRGAVVE